MHAFLIILWKNSLHSLIKRKHQIELKLWFETQVKSTDFSYQKFSRVVFVNFIDFISFHLWFQKNFSTFWCVFGVQK